MDRSIFNAILHMGFATALTSVVGLGIKLALPRLIGADQIGTLYFAESMAIMFFGFLPLGIASYISREVPRDHLRARSILATVIPAQIVLAIVIGTALFAFLSRSGSDPVTISCAIGMSFFSGASVFTRSILGRTYLALDRPEVLARIEIISRIMLVILLFGAFFSNISVTKVSWSYGLSALFGLAVLMMIAKKDDLIAMHWDPKDLKEIIVTSLPFFGVAALIEIYGNIDTAMIKYLSNNLEVAYYGSANKLKSAALVLVPIIISSLHPSLSRSWAQDQAMFKTMVSHSMRIFVALTFPMALMFIVLPDFLATLIFGPEFSPAYLAIACLAPILILTSLNVLMGACLNTIGSGVPFLVVVLLSLVVNVVLNSMAIQFAVERFGPGGAAGAAGLATATSEAVVLLAMRSIFRDGLDFKTLIQCIVLGLAPCAAVLLQWDRVLSAPLLLRIIALVGFVPAYLFLTRLLRVSDLQWFWKARKG